MYEFSDGRRLSFKKPINLIKQISTIVNVFILSPIWNLIEELEVGKKIFSFLTKPLVLSFLGFASYITYLKLGM
jgi:hypothetical protein